MDDPDGLRTAAKAADGVIHLAFQHGEPYDQAAGVDRRAIAAIGDGLAGSGRPFVVTSGTLLLAPRRVGTEADPPDPGSLAAARAGGELPPWRWSTAACACRSCASRHQRTTRSGAASSAHFGRLPTVAGTDAPASSTATRRLLGWQPSGRGLLDDLADGRFFTGIQR